MTSGILTLQGVYLSLFVFVNIWTISIHDGKYLIPGPLICLINGAAHHVDHHLSFNYNYGQYFTLWDHLGGSYRHPSALLGKGPHDYVRRFTAEAKQTQWWWSYSQDFISGLNHSEVSKETLSLCHDGWETTALDSKPSIKSRNYL